MEAFARVFGEVHDPEIGEEANHCLVLVVANLA
jgi:hypothetical protein